MPSLKPNGKRLNGKGSRWIAPARRLAIYLRDGFKCQYCGKDLTQSPARDVTLDHVVPQCQGGTHHETNLITACLTCNSRRQHLPVHVFVRLMTDMMYKEADAIPEGCERPSAAYLDGLRQKMYEDTLKRIARTRRHSALKHFLNAKNIIAGRTNPVEQHAHCPKEV